MEMPRVSIPGDTFAWSYGITLEKDEKMEYHPVAGVQDSSENLDQEVKQAAQKCVGVIYYLQKMDPKPIATGIVVHVFTSKEEDQLYKLLKQSHSFSNDYEELLGIVLTTKHTIQRQDGTDNTLNLFFSLKSEIDDIKEGELLLKPISLPTPESQEQKIESNFIDPINNFQYAVKDDVQILMLLSKTNVPLEWMKSASLKYDQQHKEQHYCIGYPGSIKVYVKRVLTSTSQQQSKSEKIPPQAYTQACPELYSLPPKQKNESLNNEVLNALKPNCRNYVKCKIIKENQALLAVSGSAFRGMSGGPLCYIKDSTLYVTGIIIGSAASPVGRFFSHFKRNFLQGKLYNSPPLESNTEALLSLSGRKLHNGLKPKRPIKEIIFSLKILLPLIYDADVSEDGDLISQFDAAIRFLQLIYRQLAQNFIINGLQCNHNLVLKNCARFKEIKSFLNGQSYCYKSVLPQPLYLFFFKEYLQNEVVQNQFKKIHFELDKIKKFKSEYEQIQSINQLFSSLQILKQEFSEQSKIKVLQNLIDLKLSSNPDFNTLFLYHQMRYASQQEIEATINYLLEETSIDKKQYQTHIS